MLSIISEIKYIQVWFESMLFHDSEQEIDTTYIQKNNHMSLSCKTCKKSLIFRTKFNKHIMKILWNSSVGEY